MNMHTHIAVLSFILLVIISVSSISVSIASYTPTQIIASSGVIIEPIRMSNHVAAYVGWFDDEDADFIAFHFDVVDTGFETGYTVSKIIALNPNIMIIGYRDIMAMHTSCEDWAEVNAHEYWFLHDVNGNRLVHKKYGWYAMDVGNEGWREHYANFVKAKLDAYPNFDGVFADDVWEWYDYRNQEFTVDASLIPREIPQRWHNDMVEMIQYVKNTIGNKFLVLNTNEWTGEYLAYADGMMMEGFVHPSWYGVDSFRQNPLSDIDALAKLSNTGKYILAHSGAMIPDNPTQTDLDKAHKIMLYCLSAYLLGVNGLKASFGWNGFNSGDGSHGYCPEFDAPLGFPVNQYYSVGSVYARDFRKGMVLVNPTTSPYTVDLDSEYKTLDGQVVLNFTLDAHSGIVLLRP
jgi:hypothetical protein